MENEFAMTASVRIATKGKDGVTQAGGGHAITVLKITTDTVYILNPWFENLKGKACIEPIPILDFMKMCYRFVTQDMPEKSQSNPEQHTINPAIQNFLHQKK